MLEPSKEIDEDYGKLKMEVFKQQCRNILGIQEQQKQAPPSDYSQDQDSAIGSDALDIVTAYKSLKLAMNKNIKGLDKGREQCQGKGYLKPTINSRQAERITMGLPPIGSSQFNES